MTLPATVGLMFDVMKVHSCKHKHNSIFHTHLVPPVLMFAVFLTCSTAVFIQANNFKPESNQLLINCVKMASTLEITATIKITGLMC